jgi:tetratricopeptide (TPR) repeat protein
MRELEESVTGPQALEVRGVEALNRGEWVVAADTFRKATALAPRSAPLHHRLGTALAMMGKAAEAQHEFEIALQASPRYAKAHYSLGLLLEDRGDDEHARREYEAAVQSAPDYATARLRLADVLRRSGRLQDALSQYERVTSDDPSLADAVLGRALTLADLGRYVEAREQLDAGMTAFREHAGFAHALARLLAAAPDDQVRDGRRALALMEQVVKTDNSTNAGEALAMALAELRRYDEAADVQRDLIAAAQRAGDAQLARALGDNLRLYQSHQPSRTIWRAAEAGRAQ